MTAPLKKLFFGRLPRHILKPTATPPLRAEQQIPSLGMKRAFPIREATTFYRSYGDAPSFLKSSTFLFLFWYFFLRISMG